jgi:hypothetical protein
MYYSDTLSPFVENILTGFPFLPTQEEKPKLDRLLELLSYASDIEWPLGSFVMDGHSQLPYAYLIDDPKEYERVFLKKLQKEKRASIDRQEQKAKREQEIDSLRKAIIILYQEYNIRKKQADAALSVVEKKQEVNDGLFKSELEKLLLATQCAVRYIAVFEIEAAVYGKSEFPLQLKSSQSESTLEVERTIEIGKWLKQRKESLTPNCSNHKTLGYTSFVKLYSAIGKECPFSKEAARRTLDKTGVHVIGQHGKNSVATGALEATISNCIDFYEKSLKP